MLISGHSYSKELNVHTQTTTVSFFFLAQLNDFPSNLKLELTRRQPSTLISPLLRSTHSALFSNIPFLSAQHSSENGPGGKAIFSPCSHPTAQISVRWSSERYGQVVWSALSTTCTLSRNSRHFSNPLARKDWLLIRPVWMSRSKRRRRWVCRQKGYSSLGRRTAMEELGFCRI